MSGTYTVHRTVLPVHGTVGTGQTRGMEYVEQYLHRILQDSPTSPWDCRKDRLCRAVLRIYRTVLPSMGLVEHGIRVYYVGTATWDSKGWSCWHIGFQGTVMLAGIATWDS